jgi:hypothetical protein
MKFEATFAAANVSVIAAAGLLEARRNLVVPLRPRRLAAKGALKKS